MQAHRARHIALVTLDPIGARISGAAIRCLELARGLSAAGHTVTVATPLLLPDARPQPFAIHQFDRSDGRATLLPHLQGCDVVLLPFHALIEFPFLAGLRIPLVIDLYDPILFEVLETNKDKPLVTRRRAVRVQTAILNQLLRRGDFFLCASERQRDLLLGALLSVGRIVPLENGDPSFRELIDVVPFGLAPPPSSLGNTTPVLKGIHPEIPIGATVLAWGGTLWDWLDPLTPIQAVAVLVARLPNLHLAFLGAGRPTDGETGKAVALQARALASKLGVKDRHVHFFEDWIPYERFGRYLRECDAGVTTHTHTLESRFAFRTRVLDYLAAELPIICTAGDVLAELVERERLGVVVPERDVSALASAMERVVLDKEFTDGCRARIREIRPQLAWDRMILPLLRFCDAPPSPSQQRNRADSRLQAMWQLTCSAWKVLTSQGPREVLRRVRLHRKLRA